MPDKLRFCAGMSKRMVTKPDGSSFIILTALMTRALFATFQL